MFSICTFDQISLALKILFTDVFFTYVTSPATALIFATVKL